MRRATRTAASWFGIVAGTAGIEHGYFEILQGNTKPEGVMIESMGPPCVPVEVWNSCEPAMTIIPNFLITGILAVIIGLFILVWSAAFVQTRHGGTVLILLSVALLLFGGGLFPPLIGIIGGVVGTKINKPLGGKQSNPVRQLAAKLWPWPLIIFIVWLYSQFLVGYYFNKLLQEYMVYSLLFIIIMLPLSAYSAYAYDVRNASIGE